MPANNRPEIFLRYFFFTWKQYCAIITKLIKSEKIVPIKKSAIKRAKQNIVRRDKNRDLKKSFRLNVKNIIKSLKTTEPKEVEKMLPEAYKALDKASKNGVIHKNNAARRKSRLMKKVNDALKNKTGVEAEKKETKPKITKPKVKKTKK